MIHDTEMGPILTLSNCGAIEEYCRDQELPSSSSIHALPTQEFHKVDIRTSRPTSGVWKPYILPACRTTLDDLLRKVFQRCRTKHLVLSLDEDWDSPIMGDGVYITLLDLVSLEVRFAKDRKFDPMTMTTILALALSNKNLTHLTLHNAGKADPDPPGSYSHCTIPRLLQHESLTHLTLMDTDITELNPARELIQSLRGSKIKVLDIGIYSGSDKPKDHDNAVGVLIQAVADTLEELTLDASPKISPFHPPFDQRHSLQLGLVFPAASTVHTLRALTRDPKIGMQKLETCRAKDEQGRLARALGGIRSNMFTSLRKIVYRTNEGESKEYSKEAGDTVEIWDKFVAVLQKSPESVEVPHTK